MPKPFRFEQSAQIATEWPQAIKGFRAHCRLQVAV